jgi:radical SAM-linked protein
LRAFERLLRRAELPFRATQGFNPHPRLVFALSLPLGVVGLAEVADLEMDEVLPVEEIHDRLRKQCPPGLDILAVRRVAPKASAQVRGLCYAVELPEGLIEATRARIAEVLAAEHCEVERRRPAGQSKGPRRVDLRPFLRGLRIEGVPAWLEMELWLTPAGTARPEEVLRLLHLDDLLETGAVLHRRRLELEDESLTPAPTGPAETGPRGGASP